MLFPFSSSVKEYYEFDSSCLKSATYDPETRRLVVTFVRGPNSYTYYGLPRNIVDGLVNAPSSGTYFRARIANRYSR